MSIIASPLGESAPFGFNINNDPDFEVLKSEIGKSGNIDYDRVESISVKILREKSKDIRVFSFLSLVYLWKGNWECFADVFEGFAILAQLDFDALKPDRKRAKHLALEWLSTERYTGVLATKNPGVVEYDQINRLINALLKIKSIMEVAFSEGSPFPSKLLLTAKSWEIACKPKVSVRVPSTVSSVSVSDLDSQNETPKQIQNAIKKAVSALTQKIPLEPLGYRLMRCLRWDILDSAPPSDMRRTQLCGPQPQQRTLFGNLIKQKEWKTVLRKAESAFSCGSNHVWLDLQRFVVTACKESGEAYFAVKYAVVQETAYLLKRVPELISLSFSDSTAFCDDITRLWLETEIWPVNDYGRAVCSPEGESADIFQQQQRMVNDMVLAGQTEQALDFLQSNMGGMADERENFRRSIMIGEVLLKSSQPEIAIPVLEYLDQKIAFFNLDKWEPALAVEAWVVLFGAYSALMVQKNQNSGAAIYEKQNRILTKITQINPKKSFLMTK